MVFINCVIVHLEHFAGSILIIICLRSVLETSFAVFSIDFLVFIIAFLFLKECLKNIKKINVSMLKIYYWANNVKSNSGEGILALSFLSLLKTKYKNYTLTNLNNFVQRKAFL